MMTRRTKISLSILLTVLFALIALKFATRQSIVIGRSMEPTLRPWDYCVSLRVRGYQPRRGDIITFRTANDPPLYLIKRVVGLPGEIVAIESGVVIINGQPLAEPYTTANPRWQMSPTLVPQGKIFVLGDNRGGEREDYVQGMVATRLVVARLVWSFRWKK